MQPIPILIDYDSLGEISPGSVLRLLLRLVAAVIIFFRGRLVLNDVAVGLANHFDLTAN